MRARWKDVDGQAPAAARSADDPASWGQVGRNELCPCGSGKRYKHCHGQLVSAS
jgi:preprotein translocase subunit SecA